MRAPAIRARGLLRATIVMICAILAGAGCGAPRLPPPHAPPSAPVPAVMAVASPQPLPALHQDGTRIVDSLGRTVQLRGVDLGGWLLWEGWIWGDGFDSETHILDYLAKLVGGSAAAAFQSAVERSFITEPDIAAIARAGFNVVRVPFNYRILEDPEHPYVWRSSGWQLLDQIVQWATANRVYVVLDMHAAPGGQANGFIYDPTSPGMWSSGSDEDQTVALWRAIAHRYSRTNTIAGYDLLNEPWAWPKSALPVVYRSIIAAIRSVDSTHMIIVEGNRDARDFSWLSRPLDHNMMYSVHLYLWARGGLSGEQHDLAGYARIAHRQGVPLWIGEFGEDYPSRVADQVRQFNGEPTVAGWAFWTWKKAPDWAGSLDAIAVSPAWRALIRWIAVPEFRRRPSPSEATRAMAQFLQAIRFAATTVNPAMVAALHAQ